MIFGKHINRYYLRYAWMLILCTLALVGLDCFQLEIPELYKLIVNGSNNGEVAIDGTVYPFDMDFLLDRICLPII